MSENSAIEWTDVTWNPVTGCSKVSPGCAHCYAETVAARFWPTQYPHVDVKTRDPLINYAAHEHEPRQFTDVQCHDDRLDQPLRWKKPRKVFVNSMSDLFHEDVPDAFIDRVFAVMALAPQHTFQILTKRAERMRAYFNVDRTELLDRIDEASAEWTHGTTDDEAWPLKNVWLGVSVENQRFADERIPLLLQTPAAVRFISAEPLLGPVDLKPWLSTVIPGACANCSPLRACDAHGRDELDWVIVGGESGPSIRATDPEWVRSLRDQCVSAGVPFFFKQWGDAHG